MKKVLAAALLCAAPVTAHAAMSIDEIATGFDLSTAVTANTRLTGDDRVFVLNKKGVIKTHDLSSNSTSTFLDLSAETVSGTYDERGLVGLTFDPNYASNGQFYVFMTAQPSAGGPVYAQVRRYTDPKIATGAPKMVWQRDLEGATNHVAGWIDFDKSGKMLIAIGDGGNGSASDVRKTGQNPADLFGSIFRIDPSADGFPGDPANNYAVPADNPAIPGGTPELYAYGVRNPYRNSVAPDGNLIIADVGQLDREELTILTPGGPNRNLGWALREGDIETPVVGGAVPPDYLAPAFVYDHLAGDKAIIGGFVYRGTEVPELFGRYVFGDQVSGNIWSILYDGTGFVDGTLELIGTIPGLSSFGETVTGELLLVEYKLGRPGRLFAITSDTVVPEPASWALMIAGFAGIGGAMRKGRRRKPAMLAG